MSQHDLFSRLAQRACADPGPQLTAETEPEFGWLDEEAVEDDAVTASPPPALTPPDSSIERPPAVTVERLVERPAPQPIPNREIKLVPMPVVVPASEPASTTSSAEAAAQPAALDLLALPATDPLPQPNWSEWAARRSDALAPVPLPPEPRPVVDQTHGTRAGVVDRPVLEVTVGRIEVRVRPPAAARTGTDHRLAEPAPALTLEEYLRRREVPS